MFFEPRVDNANVEHGTAPPAVHVPRRRPSSFGWMDRQSSELENSNFKAISTFLSCGPRRNLGLVVVESMATVLYTCSAHTLWKHLHCVTTATTMPSADDHSQRQRRISHTNGY